MKSNKLILISALALASALVGCASTPQSHARIDFPASEYAKYSLPGDSTVSGDAVIEQYNAAVTHPSNPTHEIFLLPATSYSAQAIDIVFDKCFSLAPPDARQEQYVRRLPTVSNGSFEAKFEFKNVPAGNYWAVDRLTYDLEHTSEKGFRVRLTRVKVESNKNVTDVKIRPPEDNRRGGQFSTTFG